MAKPSKQHKDGHGYVRRQRTLRLPITLSVVLMTLNVTLMVCWIVLLSQTQSWSALTIGTVVFALILVGLIVYLFVTVKEVRLNQRQSNFVDSVTHELKTPIAALRLYLETLQIRKLDDEQRADFYHTMEQELQRLDGLINQLLEVARLDAVGQQVDPEDIVLDDLLRRGAAIACSHHQQDPDAVLTFDMQQVVVHSRRVVLEMIFNNLLDNAVKYAGSPPLVTIRVAMNGRNRVSVQIIDNGPGVPGDMRKQIFKMFYRGGSELERRQKGTGLGLYISRTLAHILKGEVSVRDRTDAPGSIFEVELPGRPAL
jgi:two-component system, OmpR family, phosphate regulon sensor histidine kinase PhoR